MKQPVVFMVADLTDVDEADGICGALAPYQLSLYLQSFPTLHEQFDFEVIRFRPAASQPVIMHCRGQELTLNLVLRRKPVAVAFSLYLWNIRACHDLALSLKSVAPQLLVIAGGPEVAERPDFVKQFPGFDVIVEGDGEVPLRLVMERLARGDRRFEGIGSVSYREGDGFRHEATARKAELPENIPNVYSHWSNLLEECARQFCSRGCENACTYCLWARQEMVNKGPERLAEELEAIASSGRTRRIAFYDYDFVRVFHDEPAAFARLQAFFEQHPWICSEIFVNSESVDDPWIEHVCDALRVARLYVGVQSFYPAALKAAGRAWSIPGLSHLENASSAIRRRAIVEMMYPLPKETFASFTSGLQRLLDCGICGLQVFPLSALRGTVLRRKAADLGLVYQHEPPYLVTQTPSFSRDQWLDAAGLSYILSQLTHILFEEDASFARLQSVLCGSPGRIDQILAELRSGKPPAFIVADMVDQGGEVAGRLDWVGDHPVNFVRTQSGPQRQDEPAAEPGYARHLFPDFSVLNALLEQAECKLEREVVQEYGLVLHLQSPKGPLQISLAPDSAPGPCFARVGAYKLSHLGVLVDSEVMKRISEALQAL